ncbi:MAG: hypothetical protein EOO24_02215 [Comamonadaceae bacterium]|nr:MAG: hypothetical protein EOO24_02215 [Comamonadaceae bacterium]
MPPNTQKGLSPYRLVFVFALVVVVIAQIVAMVSILQNQVQAAKTRESLEASARIAAARCFESSAARGMDMCRAAGVPRDFGMDPRAGSDKAGEGVVSVSYGYAASN